MSSRKTNVTMKGTDQRQSDSHINTAINLHDYVFDIDLSYIHTIPQENTNRCWLISAISEPLSRFCKETGLSEFKLSLNYITFWDCIEKCNLFFNNIILTKKHEILSNEVQSLLQAGIDDGGDWFNAAEIILKYGVVPEYSMPETPSSSNPEVVYTTIIRYAKHVASELRTCKTEAQTDLIKNKAISKIYSYLVDSCGNPPSEIIPDFDLSNALNVHSNSVTPQQLANIIFGDTFYKQLSFVSINSSQLEYNTKYLFPYNGYQIIASCAEFINIEFQEFKSLIIEQIMSGHAIPIACDTRFSSNPQHRIFDVEIINKPLNFKISKICGFDYKLLRINHCMLIIGIKKLPDNTYLWKLANSWATKPEDYYIATDKWFDTFVFEAILPNPYNQEQIFPQKFLLPNSIIL